MQFSFLHVMSSLSFFFSLNLKVQWNNSSWLVQLCVISLSSSSDFQPLTHLRVKKKKISCGAERFHYLISFCCDTELHKDQCDSLIPNIIQYWQSWINSQWLPGIKHHKILCSKCCPLRREDSAPQGATIIINSCSSFPSFVWSSIITPPGE